MIYNHIPVTIGCLPKVTAAPINFQYDQVQILQIEGIELPTSYRVDFCNPGNSATISMVGTEDGVQIPNQLLATGLPVIAYVVLTGTDENAVETRYQITIPVNKRPPASDIQPTPAEQSTIDSLIEAMNDAVDAAEDAQEAAELAQGGAETAETGAEAQALKAEGYAVGTQDGTPVSSDSPYYENNAEYMKDAAAQYAFAADTAEGEAAAWATGSYSGNPSGIPVPDDAPQHNNNAHYYKEQAAASAAAAEAALEQFTTPTASASTLPAGSSATASYNNGNFAFGIPKGDKGDPGTDGTDGTDGVSPEVTITSITGGHAVKITDADHPAGQSFNVMDGTDGTDGTDGVSPEVTITSITGGHTVKITDADHPTGQSFNVMDGANTDADDVTYDPTETYTAGSVGAGLNQLNSDINDLNLAKAPIITDTASGAIASFPDGADGLPIKQLTVAVNPVQDLHGYDHPWPAGGGKNMLPIILSDIKSLNTSGTWNGNAYTSTSGIVYTIEANAVGAVTGIKVNGTASSTSAFRIASMVTLENGTSYILNGCPSGGGSSKYELMLTSGLGGSAVANDYGSGTTFTGNSSISYAAQIVIRSGQTVSNIMFYPMVRLSSVSDATFAPYSNECPISGWTGVNVHVADGEDPHVIDNIYPITFPDSAGTVYGGDLTVNEDGTGTIVDALNDVDLSQLSWTTNYTGTINKVVTADITAALVTSDTHSIDGIAENYANRGNKGSVGQFSDPDSLDVGFYCVAGSSTTNTTKLRLVIGKNDSPAGKLVYRLYTEPSPIALTGLPQVWTLYGQNNWWTDTGDLTINYRADTKLYLEKLTAPTEDDLIANSAIASGTFFMIGNTLYKATAAIANGANITVGTNATQLSLADALNQLNS